MKADPFSCSRIRISIIGFADDARVELEMADFRKVSEVPTQSLHGQKTCYSAAFDQVRERIPEDIEGIRRQGYRVFRPAVFFLPHREADEEGPVPPVRLVTVATEVVLPRAHAPHPPLVVARATVLGDGLSAGVRDEPFPANPHTLTS
jgi:hypothetical protein